MKNRIAEIDMLRGFAIILVILGHSFILTPVNIHDIPWCKATFDWIYSFHMELFFLLSGCVYKCTQYLPYIKKKADRILVPYLFFGLISLLLGASGIGAVNRHFSFQDGLYKFLFNGGEYWFLYVLFLFFAVYPLIERSFKSTITRIVVVLGLIVIGSLVRMPNLLCLSSFVHHLPFFILGTLIIDFVPKLISIRPKRACLLSLFSVVIYFIISGLENKLGGGKFLMSVLMIIPFFFISVLIVRCNEMKSKVLKTFFKLLEDCSRYSLQLYLFNGFLLVAIRIMLCSVLRVTNPIVIVLVIVIGNIVISLALCKYVIPKNSVLSYLCGMPKKSK